MSMAWVTLLTQPEYLVGVRALQRSLTLSGSRYPLVVMVTENIAAAARRQLVADGSQVRDVAPLSPNPQLANRYANARFSEVWSKLRAWQLTEFSRVVFLDADMLVTQNMDELFKQPLAPDALAACHACRCNPNHIDSHPADWVPENCFYSLCRGEDHLEQPDRVDNYLNSGLLVLKPDEQVFAQMLAQLAALDDLSEYRFPEQDFLNQFYRQRWQPLPWIYNALKTLPDQHPAIWDRKRAKNLHFILDKPWQRPPDPQSRYYALDKAWWQVAEGLS